MKTSKSRALIVFLTLITIQSFAQPSYREGFVVGNNGDTTKGWIDYREWDDNPDQIRFKSDPANTESVTYTLNDITGFEVTGLDRYVRAVVSKDMRPVAIDKLEFATDSTVTDTVFLRVLLEGTVSLYQYDDFKVHFYIKQAGKDYEELQYKLYLDKGMMSKRQTFRDQIRVLFPNSHDLSSLPNLLKVAEYKESDLIKLVEKLNGSIAGGSVQYKVRKVKQPVTVFVGAGLVYSKLSFSGDRFSLANLEYSKGFKPMFAGGVDLHLGRNHQRLALRVELNWYKLSYEGTNGGNNRDTVNYQLKLTNISPSLSLLYNVISYPKSKLYVGGGVTYNLSKYDENRLTRKYSGTGGVQTVSPYLEFEERWVSMQLRAGYIFNNKIEIAGSMRVGGSFSNFSGIALNPSLTFFGMNYRF